MTALSWVQDTFLSQVNRDERNPRIAIRGLRAAFGSLLDAVILERSVSVGSEWETPRELKFAARYTKTKKALAVETHADYADGPGLYADYA